MNLDDKNLEDFLENFGNYLSPQSKLLIWSLRGFVGVKTVKSGRILKVGRDNFPKSHTRIHIYSSANYLFIFNRLKVMVTY